VGDLTARSASDLRYSGKGIGPSTLLEIRLALGEYGLGLCGDTQIEYFTHEAAALPRRG